MTQHNWKHRRNTSASISKNALYVCTGGCGHGVYIYDITPSTMTINFYWNFQEKRSYYSINQNCDEYKLKNLLQ